MEVIIPTRNDVKFLDSILHVLDSIEKITKIHVVNNNSTPKNTRIIKDICSSHSKCFYYFCKKKGKGSAIKHALVNLKEDVLFLDADIENLRKEMITILINKFYSNALCDFIKANFIRRNGQSNSIFVSNYIRDNFPSLKVNRPTCGIYAVKKNVIDELDIRALPNNWAIDLGILLEAHLKGKRVVQENLGCIVDKKRNFRSICSSKKHLETYLKGIESCDDYVREF